MSAASSGHDPLTAQRAGSLVVHAWIEDTDPPCLRVRVTPVDERGDGPPGAAFTNIDAAVGAVRAWLDELVRRDRDRAASGRPPR